MKKTGVIRKVYKKFGMDTGDQYMVLLYSYVECVKAIGKKDYDQKLEEFNTRFCQYVRKRFGEGYYESYGEFYLENRKNIRLLKKLGKEKEDYLDRNVLALLKEPEKSEKKEDEKKEDKKKKDDLMAAREADEVKPVAKVPVVAVDGLEEEDRSEEGPLKHDSAEDVTQLTTSQHFFGNEPSKNISYIPFAQSRHRLISYKFTLKRRSNGEEFTTYRSGRNVDEAMAIVNRVYFDSAGIVSVEEEESGKKVL